MSHREKRYCGIDPGVAGAVAVIGEDGWPIHVYDVPLIRVGKRQEVNLDLLIEWFTRDIDSETRVAMERFSPYPGKAGEKRGAQSMFRFGDAHGVLRTIVRMMGCPLTPVAAQTWKAAMLAGTPKDKGAAILRAQQLWPGLSLTRQKDHHQAEALLISEWLRRQHQQTVPD